MNKTSKSHDCVQPPLGSYACGTFCGWEFLTFVPSLNLYIRSCCIVHVLVSSNQSVTTMRRGQEGLTGFLSSCFVWQERDEKHWLNQGCSPRLKTMVTSQILVTKQSHFRLILICGLKSNSKCVREKFDWIKVKEITSGECHPFPRRSLLNTRSNVLALRNQENHYTEHTIQCACIEKPRRSLLNTRSNVLALRNQENHYTEHTIQCACIEKPRKSLYWTHNPMCLHWEMLRATSVIVLLQNWERPRETRHPRSRDESNTLFVATEDKQCVLGWQ